jgi:hypothetical protein
MDILTNSPRILQAHCQSRTSQLADQSFVKELAKPNPEKRNFKKCPTARQKTMKMIATNRPTNHGRQGSTGGNRRLAQWRVKWLIEHSTSHQLLWCIDSFVLRNPPLRQAPKRV